MRLQLQESPAIVRKAMLWLTIAGLVIATGWILSPFLLSLCMGAMFALALEPLEEYIRTRFRVRRLFSSLATSGLFLVVILIPVIFMAFKLVGYSQELPTYMEGFVETKNKVVPFLADKVQDLGFAVNFKTISTTTAAMTTKLWTFISDAATSFIANLPETLLQFTIMMLTVFVVLFKRREHLGKMFSLGFVSRPCLLQLRNIVSKSCHDVVFANILTGLAQSFLVTLGALAFTSYDPFLIFIVTFIASFIPIIGAGPVMFLMGVLQLFNGATANGIVLIALTAVVGVSDNILRAFLMAKNKDDDAFLNLLAVIGGIYIWGLPGIFMGPLLLSITIKALPILVQETLKEKNTYPVLSYHSFENGREVAHRLMKRVPATNQKITGESVL